MEEDQEELNSSLMALTSHFAKVGNFPLPNKIWKTDLSASFLEDEEKSTEKSFSNERDK